jgi:hypothetical protein
VKKGSTSPEKWITRFCTKCGVSFQRLRSKARRAPCIYCSDGCRLAAINELNFGDGNPRWNGGRTWHALGYAWVLIPNHPYADKQGHVLEHRLIAEKALGRHLPIEHPVHHADLDPSQNANSNLVICEDQAYHALLHARTNQVRRGAIPGLTKWCSGCDSVKPIEEFGMESARWDGRNAACLVCKRTTSNRRYHRRIRQTPEAVIATKEIHAGEPAK